MSDRSPALESSISIAPALAGYVEAVTENAALGWVWSPGRSDKVSVELRLGTQIVSCAIAGDLREDLARSGIGDGRHAFTLPVPAELRPRVRELRVFALTEGGIATALDAPAAANAVADGATAQLLRGMEVILGSQRLMHRNLQAALLQKGPSVSASLADVTTAQVGLQEQIATFELFAVRLEQALLARETTATVPVAGRALVVVTGVSGLALVTACVALGRVMLGN